MLFYAWKGAKFEVSPLPSNAFWHVKVLKFSVTCSDICIFCSFQYGYQASAAAASAPVPCA